MGVKTRNWVNGPNTGPATATRVAAALQRKLAAAETLLLAHGYRVIQPKDVTLPETKVGPPTTTH